MHCTIPVGVLRDRYQVHWYKGLTNLSNSLTDDEFRHISRVNQSTLVFSGVKETDNSKAYYCTVTVDRRNGMEKRQGSTIELNVIGEYNDNG